MSRNLSDVVGHLFPTTQVGSYPRPSWNTFDVRDRDFRVAMRDAQFAEAYSDGVRAMIGDQLDAGIDVPTDGHLWYDRHQGFISSFLLYPAYHLDGIAVEPEINPLMPGFGAPTTAAFGGTWNKVVVDGPIGRGTMHLADLWTVADQVSPKPVKFCSGMGPANLAGWLTDEHYHDKEALYADLADAYNAEFKEAVAAGVTILQLDDVGFTLHAPDDYPLVLKTLNRALEGVDAFKIFHICHLGSGVNVGVTPYTGFHELVANELDVDAVEYAFAETDFPDSDLELWKRYPSDKGLGLGVINIKKLVVETEDEILAGVRKALEYVEPERIHLTTDCGQFSIPRPMAKGKLEAMVGAARTLREEIGG
jgi:5-methyltetrahydropteroyltriglutamate--homocysteine methyltransferase